MSYIVETVECGEQVKLVVRERDENGDNNPNFQLVIDIKPAKPWVKNDSLENSTTYARTEIVLAPGSDKCFVAIVGELVDHDSGQNWGTRWEYIDSPDR